MKVLITGATGFIGHPAALAFARAGHFVFGQTRSQSSATSLARDEIVPVICDPTSDRGLKAFVTVATHVDVVIDTIPFESADGPLRLFDAFVQSVKDRPAGAKAAYIYCGGSWTISRGDGGLETWTDERQPNSGRVQLTKWRSDVETKVMSNDDVHGIVIRPGVLYGRSGSLPGMMVFQAALEAKRKGEKFEAIGVESQRLGTIHQDDLADLFLRVAERAPICRGNAFVGHNPQSERLVDVLDAVVRVSGVKGYTLRPPRKDAPFENAWGDSTTHLKPTLGEVLTGWRPRKMGLVDGMDLYFASFQAHNQK